MHPRERFQCYTGLDSRVQQKIEGFTFDVRLLYQDLITEMIFTGASNIIRLVRRFCNIQQVGQNIC